MSIFDIPHDIRQLIYQYLDKPSVIRLASTCTSLIVVLTPITRTYADLIFAIRDQAPTRVLEAFLTTLDVTLLRVFRKDIVKAVACVDNIRIYRSLLPLLGSYLTDELTVEKLLSYDAAALLLELHADKQELLELMRQATTALAARCFEALLRRLIARDKFDFLCQVDWKRVLPKPRLRAILLRNLTYATNEQLKQLYSYTCYRSEYHQNLAQKPSLRVVHTELAREWLLARLAVEEVCLTRMTRTALTARIDQAAEIEEIETLLTVATVIESAEQLPEHNSCEEAKERVRDKSSCDEDWLTLSDYERDDSDDEDNEYYDSDDYEGSSDDSDAE